VAAIGLRDSAGIFFGIAPGRDPLDPAVLVNDPLPRDQAALARLFEQAVDALHFVLGHRGDQASDEQLVSDAAAGDRLHGLRDGAHRVDEIERSLPHAATTYFGTAVMIWPRGDSGRGLGQPRRAADTPVVPRSRA